MWIKISLREISPSVVVAYRVTFGLLFGAGFILVKHISLPGKFSDWKPLLILGITNLAIPFYLISWGERSIDSSVAAILDATFPLFTILIAHFLLDDDKMTVPKVFGLLIGFVGVVILLSKDIGASRSSILGEAAVIIASIFYAGSTVYLRRTTQTVHSILGSAGPLLSASFVMWLMTFFTEKSVQLPKLPLTWIALLFLGVIGSGFAFTMEFYLIHKIGPTKTSMVTYIYPLGGVILGIAFLHEQITWQLPCGAIFIIASLVVANLHPKYANIFKWLGTEED